MKIQYKFISDQEPTDEQLHLLMLEVVAEVKKKAQLANALYLEQLQNLLLTAKAAKSSNK